MLFPNTKSRAVGMWAAAACVALLCGWATPAMAQGTAANLLSPVRLVLDPQGGLAVSDQGARSVVFLEPTNHTVVDRLRVPCKECDDPNIKGREFARPLGLAFLGELLLIGSSEDNKVAMYERGGKAGWRQKGWLGGGRGVSVPYPMDIDVDQDLGRIFGVSRTNKSVMVFDQKGDWLYSFPEPCADSCPAGLVDPMGVAVDAARQLVMVMDAGDPSGFFSPDVAPRVQIFDYNGVHRGTISGASFQFSRPLGIAVDAFGRVYLADGVRSQVLVFQDAGGEWTSVTTLGSFGFGPDQLALPMDVVVDPQSLDVVVISNRAGRVVVFQQGGVLP